MKQTRFVSPSLLGLLGGRVSVRRVAMTLKVNGVTWLRRMVLPEGSLGPDGACARAHSTVNIRLYGTLGHFVAPVSAMHSCGSMYGSCPESLAIVFGSAKIAAGGSFQTLSIAHSETKTGLSAFRRSPWEATKYLWQRI